MSAPQKLRETVEHSRDSGSPNQASTPHAISGSVRSTLDLIAKLSQSATKPGFSLEEFLGEQGFRRGGDEDEVDSSFSFNFAEMSGSSTSFSTSPTSVHKAREKKNISAAMSSKIAHKSWIVNQGNEDSTLIDDDPKSQLVTVYTAATIMFIDLSGYSKITAALANAGGAHALSTAVNAYFGAILSVVERFGGDVLSFAGDAICVCWPADPGKEVQAATNACACAMDLQLKCGMSPLAGTDLFFRLHIGITHGDIQSEILLARSYENMQAAYHYVSGPPLMETASVVDGAKIGEVCITDRVRSLCGPRIDCKMVGSAHNDDESQTESIYLLTHVDIMDDDDLDDVPDEAPAPLKRNPLLDEGLVPPAIQRKLRQGFKPEHLAEMRFLCVLFIKKSYEEVSAKEWFSEVQEILDDCRCPIVQMIHDDKGTHLIAAVNLFVTERAGADTAIAAARRLQERETGCVVGVACGEVFCGLTGSSDVACRWDITGPACVRACRLMQHGVESGHSTVLDQSIFLNTSDSSQMDRLEHPVALKGSAEPVVAYVLSKHSIAATAGIISTSWMDPSVHSENRAILQAKLLQTPIQKGAVIVDGPIGSGKKTMLVAALEMANVTKLIHFATRDVQPLSIIKTVAEWFLHHKDQTIANIANSMLASLGEGKLTRTLSLFHSLVEQIIAANISFCLVIVYANLVDNPSFNLIKSIITSPPSNGDGRFLFALTAYPIYGAKTSKELGDALQWALNNTRTASKLSASSKLQRVQQEVVRLEIEYPNSSKTFATAFASTSYFHLHEKASQILHEATGGCLMLIVPLLKHMNTVYINKDRPIRTDLMPLTQDGMLHLTTAGEDYLMSQIYWPSVAPSESSRFMELYDQLPPKYQLILRVIASLSTTTGAANPHHVAAIMGKLNSRIKAEKVVADVQYLAKLKILREVDEDGGEFRFSVPAMLDVVGSLLTPDQDRLLKRQAYHLAKSYYDGDGEADTEPQHMPIFTSFIAKLARAAGDINIYKTFMVKSWDLCVELTKDGAFPDVLDRMEERLAIESRLHPESISPDLFSGCTVKPKLQDRQHVGNMTCKVVPPIPYAVKYIGASFYPPISLGAISGELQFIGWFALNNWLDLTKLPDHVFLADEFRGHLKVDVNRMMDVFAAFDQKIPFLSEEEEKSFTSQGSDVEAFELMDELILPLSLPEERKLLETFVAVPTNIDAALKQCRTFVAYCSKVIQPRRWRLLSYVKTLKGEMVKKLLIPDDPASRALLRFADLEKRNSLGIHEALLDLATEGWTGKYYNLNLQGIRDQIFKHGTADGLDFVAMLVSLRLFGDSISKK